MNLSFIEILKVIFLGIVEGITEWLPISSTGHMLLVDEFLQLNASDSFKEMFFIIIQLGAILAVVVLYWNRMFPFQFKDKAKPVIRKDIFSLWFKVVVACIPGAAVTILFDDYIEAHLHTPVVIAIADIAYQPAFMIGLFQVLSIIPGTSRSGATIIGGLIIGVSRVAVAEFTFYLAVPVMLGMSLLKLLKFGFAFTGAELVILGVGTVVAFLVSIVVIRFLMSYIRKHDFKVFGWYRIVLGALVLVYFAFR